MLDCVIIGSGPAGISAALTLKANGKNFVMLGKKSLSSKIEKAERITNYPGLNSITGKDFCAALKWQLSNEEIEVVEGNNLINLKMPDSLEHIGNYALANTRLDSIYIPQKVNYISPKFISGSIFLQKIDVDLITPDKTKSINEGEIVGYIGPNGARQVHYN